MGQADVHSDVAGELPDGRERRPVDGGRERACADSESVPNVHRFGVFGRLLTVSDSCSG